MPKMRPRPLRSGETDPLKLTSRDLELIRDVAEFRFLNTEHSWLCTREAKGISCLV